MEYGKERVGFAKPKRSDRHSENAAGGPSTPQTPSVDDFISDPARLRVEQEISRCRRDEPREMEGSSLRKPSADADQIAASSVGKNSPDT